MLLVAAILCLSVAACGSSEPATTKAPTKTPTEAPTDAPTEPVPVKIEITIDNWQEYFEIVYREEPLKNEFGDITDLATGHYLVLKDKYAQKNELSIFNCDVVMEFTYYRERFFVEFDKETGDYTILGMDEQKGTYEATGAIHYVRGNDEILAGGGAGLSTTYDGTQTMDFNRDPTITRVQGSITIIE